MTLRCPFERCGEQFVGVIDLTKHLDNGPHDYPPDIAKKLAELVAEKQQEPKPIGPTEADNWEYIGERWVKKEK